MKSVYVIPKGVKENIRLQHMANETLCFDLMWTQRNKIT